MDIYGYDLHPVDVKIREHLDNSLKQARSNIKSAFVDIYNKYAQIIEKEVEQIISGWITILEMELKKGASIYQQQNNKVQKLEQEKAQLQQLKQKVQSL